MNPQDIELAITALGYFGFELAAEFCTQRSIFARYTAKKYKT